jgi:hypothetical protein
VNVEARGIFIATHRYGYEQCFRGACAKSLSFERFFRLVAEIFDHSDCLEPSKIVLINARLPNHTGTASQEWADNC